MFEISVIHSEQHDEISIIPNKLFRYGGISLGKVKTVYVLMSTETIKFSYSTLFITDNIIKKEEGAYFCLRYRANIFSRVISYIGNVKTLKHFPQKLKLRLVQRLGSNVQFSTLKSVRMI